MKIQLKSLAPVALGLALAVAGGSSFAKGHDQGVADGDPLADTGQFSLGGAIAGISVAGIGFVTQEYCDTQEPSAFCGVVDRSEGLIYGQDIVVDQMSEEFPRVVPVVNGQR